MSSHICPACQMKNFMDSTECMNCGTALPAHPQATQAAQVMASELPAQATPMPLSRAMPVGRTHRRGHNAAGTIMGLPAVGSELSSVRDVRAVPSAQALPSLPVSTSTSKAAKQTMVGLPPPPSSSTLPVAPPPEPTPAFVPTSTSELNHHHFDLDRSLAPDPDLDLDAVGIQRISPWLWWFLIFLSIALVFAGGALVLVLFFGL